MSLKKPKYSSINERIEDELEGFNNMILLVLSMLNNRRIVRTFKSIKEIDNYYLNIEKQIYSLFVENNFRKFITVGNGEFLFLLSQNRKVYFALKGHLAKMKIQALKDLEVKYHISINTFMIKL